MRKRLNHTTHFAGRFGAIYFITICCQQRGSKSALPQCESWNPNKYRAHLQGTRAMESQSAVAYA
jgi:hypothetical protein